MSDNPFDDNRKLTAEPAKSGFICHKDDEILGFPIWWFEWNAHESFNGIFAAYGINAFWSLVGLNVFFSIFAFNALFSIASIVSTRSN